MMVRLAGCVFSIEEGDYVDFKAAIPIIEGKLYAWGLRQQDMPGPVVSKPFDEPSIDPKNKRDSLQEIWVLKNQYEIWETKTINEAVSRMSREQKELIRMRYIERLRWDEIAENLGCEHRACFRIRDGILMILAYEFKLLGENGKMMA